MPPTFPRVEADRVKADLDEEARLEGPTAVSTPVRHASFNPSTPLKDGEKPELVSPVDIPLQEAVDQPLATNTGPVEEPIIVTFKQPYDPENPYQWPRLKKIRIAVLVLTYALVSGDEEVSRP